MAKIDILYRTEPKFAEDNMVTAIIVGGKDKWGPANRDETLGWRILKDVETDLSIEEIRSRCKVVNRELVLKPESEWWETKTWQQDVFAAAVDAVVNDRPLDSLAAWEQTLADLKKELEKPPAEPEAL